MLAWVCLIPVTSFTLLALAGKYMPRRLAATVGCVSVATSGVLIARLIPQMMASGRIQETWGPWIEGAGALTAAFSFQLDPLSATMAGIVCFVGFLIHFYSSEYMAEDADHNRFFAYLNLFVGAMLLLLLADDMLLLFLGWEGVGLCSYLLIGFWYQERYNIQCAEKAFLMTRIGDVAFIVALFIIFMNFGSWSLPDILQVNSGTMTTWVAGLLLVAALSKSAQVPLTTWLPDAMAGPTPVSALLHSSTMVTAGVYLIARFHPYFVATPDFMYAVAVIGAGTALYAGITAIGQNDIKRILAYSTISQIGFMFLALGVGAFSAAVFHFFTHAFFKALLFLGAGAVIHAVHGEQDIRKLGGLRRKLPVTFWTFVAGAAALAALPLVTSGFYSKDAILWDVFHNGHLVLWAVGITTAACTGWYSARMVFHTFFGAEYSGKIHVPGIVMRLPLVILAVLALVSGFVEVPSTIGGGIHLWEKWMGDTFLVTGAYEHGDLSTELFTQIVAVVAGITGVLIAYWIAFKRRIVANSENKTLANGFYIDSIYQKVFVGGFQGFSRLLQREWVDSFLNGALALVRGGNRVMVATQSGRVRWYVMGLVVGGIVMAAMILWI